MDIVSALTDDHDVIRKFIQELELAESLPIKNKIFTEMLIFVQAHFRSEETSLYSKSLRSPFYEMNEFALDGYEEHHLLDDLVYRIKNAKHDDTLWLSRVKDFCQILDLHLAGEEADFFPDLKNYFTPVELAKAAVVYLKCKKSEITLAEQDQIRNYSTSSPNLMN